MPSFRVVPVRPEDFEEAQLLAIGRLILRLAESSDLIARKQKAPAGEDRSRGSLGVEELTPLDVAGTTLPPLADQCKR